MSRLTYDKDKMIMLLKENKIPVNNSKRKGEFFRSYYNWGDIKTEYESGKSLTELGRIYNLSYDVVRENLKRIGVIFRDFKLTSKYKINYNEFFPKCTNKGAYALGWIYSDGCITKDKLNFAIQRRDLETLQNIADIISNKEPVLNTKGYAELSIYNVEFCKNISEYYNVLPKKSFKNFSIPLNKFNNQNFPYLLLGLIEGDGCISKQHLNLQIILSSNSWFKIKYNLIKLNLINNKDLRIYKLNNYGTLNINIRGISYFKVLNYIYSNTYEIKPMERKYNLFLSQLDRSIQGKTSPYKYLAKSIRDSLIS